MIMIQQESIPFPHPHPQPLPLLLPQNKRRRIIHIIELQEVLPTLPKTALLPHPLSQPHPRSQPQLCSHPHPQRSSPHPQRSSPHPQFVAAKSLIFDPPNLIYTVLYVPAGKVLQMKRIDNILKNRYNKNKFVTIL